jgi:hypothetical protein
MLFENLKSPLTGPLHLSADSSFLSSPLQDWQRAWEMNLLLLALPTAYVLWRWFLALFTKTALVTQP